MSQDNKLFQDIAKMANSAFTTANNLKNELVNIVKQQVESFIKGMNFVTREEFEAVKKLAAKNQLDIQKIIGTKPKEFEKKDVSIKRVSPKSKTKSKTDS